MSSIAILIPSTDPTQVRRMMTLRLDDTDHVRAHARNIVADIRDNEVMPCGGEHVHTNIMVMACTLSNGDKHYFTKVGGWFTDRGEAFRSLNPEPKPRTNSHEPCHRCGGSGVLPQFHHHHNGICFRCGGMGAE